MTQQHKTPSEIRRLARREAERSRNKLIFGLPLANYFSADRFDLYMQAFDGRPYVKTIGQYITLAHNIMVHSAREQDAAVFKEYGEHLFDYLVFCEHDHRWPWQEVWAAIEEYDPEQYPVVAHLYPTRSYPIMPVGYNFDEETKAFTPFSEEQIRFWKRESPGLHRADGVPMGLTAIHRTVFERLEEFNPDAPFFAAPVSSKGIDGMGDDIYFSMRCREAGIPVHVDTRFNVEHWGEIPFSFDMYFAQMEAIHAAERAAEQESPQPKIEVVKAIEVPKLTSIGGISKP